MSTLELNLSEENEIGFKLRIEGSDKDIGSSKPMIRFVLTEKDSGKGWIFSTEKTDEGVAVIVPVMKGIVSENNKYSGKLEVILGGRYFTPTEVDVDFVEPLKVEAVVSTNVSKKNNIKLLEEKKEESKEPEFSIESEIDSIIVKDKENKNIPFKALNEEEELMDVNKIYEIKKPTNYNDLDNEQKDFVNKMFMEKCNKLGISSKEIKKLMTEGSSYTKKRLKALLALSTKEYISQL